MTLLRRDIDNRFDELVHSISDASVIEQVPKWWEQNLIVYSVGASTKDMAYAHSWGSGASSAESELPSISDPEGDAMRSTRRGVTETLTHRCCSVDGSVLDVESSSGWRGLRGLLRADDLEQREYERTANKRLTC